MWHKLMCFIGRHDLTMIKKLSDQAALCECDYCHDKWAVKMIGDCAGAFMPWVEAQFFYTDERIASTFRPTQSRDSQ